MAKEAYYFSHDANARRDPKILAMRNEYGTEGYGWYWIIIEMLSEQQDYKLKHTKWVTNAIAMEMLCEANSVEKFVNSCINDYELFESDGEYFWSESLVRRMNLKEEKRRKKVEAGRKGAQSRWSNGNDNSNAKHSDSNAIAQDGKGKESKGKESKEKTNTDYSDDFETFWKLYPRKIDKKKANTSFKTAIKKHPLETILEGTKGYIDNIEKEGTDKKYIKHGATFLNNHSFLDFVGSGEPEVKQPEKTAEDKQKDRVKELKAKVNLGRDYWAMTNQEELYDDMERELRELEQF